MVIRHLGAAVIAAASLAIAATPATAAQWFKTTDWVIDSVDYKAVARASAPDITTCDAFDTRAIAATGTYTVEGHLRPGEDPNKRLLPFSGTPRIPSTSLRGLHLNLVLDRRADERQHVFTPVPPPDTASGDDVPPASCTQTAPDCSETHPSRKTVNVVTYPGKRKGGVGIWLDVGGTQTEPMDLSCGQAQGLAPHYDNKRHRLAVAGWPTSGTGFANRWTLPSSALKKPRVTLRVHRAGGYSYTRKEFGQTRTVTGTATLDAAIHIRLVHGRCRVTRYGCIRDF